MRTLKYRRNSVGKACVVIVIFFLLLIPGYALAGTPNLSMDPTPHKPAYLQIKSDLVDVQVPPRFSPMSPVPPTTMNLDITELLQQVDESLILGYLENLTSFGPRLTGTPACDQSAHYIYETFHDMGLAVRYHNYTDNTVSGSNVEATLYGTDSTNVFIICGHYDSVAAGPGADDDGSGVAAVLAAAEIMKNYEFYHTIRFVAFSGEEQGLIGSYHYVEDAYNNNDTIIAVLNADMIGFAPLPSDGTKGKIYENDASEWIVSFTQDISQIYAAYIGIELSPQGETWGSDHYYFWQFGYDAVFYHEENFNDYYHSANDTIAHMNLNYSARFTRLILATLAEMALQPRPVLEVSSISGGLGITTQVTNVGEVNASIVNVTISVTGGLLGLYAVSSTNGIDALPPLDSLQSKAKLFRIGNIQIGVTAGATNADEVTKHATGFLLGPFVLRLVITP
ncbi:MAG: M28 family metallopeptidase [Euryarchaeota archaeon]|nr:M28 family metallopeptidase [Euryarchaeota archaeon]